MTRALRRLRPMSSSQPCWTDYAQPELVGAMAFRRFCTPQLSTHRSHDHDKLVERARFHLRDAGRRSIATSVGDLQAYVFEPLSVGRNASVLLVHGWTSEASFMAAFAEQLRRRGFRAVLLDLPAHGRSSGNRTSLMDCAHAVREAAEALGPIRYVIAHSLGGMAALLAAGGRLPMPRAYPFEAFVLVAMPNRFADVTRKFAEQRGLSPAAARNFEQRLERLAKRRIADFTGVNLLAEAGQPALVLHSHDDPDVPLGDAREVSASSSLAELSAFDGLGHRKILYAPPVVRAATAFLERQYQLSVSGGGRRQHAG